MEKVEKTKEMVKIPAYIVRFVDDYKYLCVESKEYDEGYNVIEGKYFAVLSILEANYYTDYDEAVSDAEIFVEDTDKKYEIVDVFIEYESFKKDLQGSEKP